MAARRRARWAGFAVIATATAGATVACNALTGAPDRVLDESGDSSTGRVRADAAGPDVKAEAAAPLPQGVDAGDGGPVVTFIDVPPPFATLNGATWSTTDAGTTITAYASASHPVIVPMVQPAIPAEDYTVHATVRAPTNGEFGILTRVQPGGGAFVFASQFGGENRQFLGSFAPPDWNPSLDARVPTAYVYVPNGRYKFQLKAVGDQISGKMWEAGETEPAAFQVIAIAPWSTGRGVGYYTYLTNGAVLESLRVSVP